VALKPLALLSPLPLLLVVLMAGSMPASSRRFDISKAGTLFPKRPRK
jgi:hypothetical protein